MNIRLARREDARDIAALFQIAYAESSHPCKREDFVASSLQRRRTDVWHVSEADGRVTGCMGMLVHRWNQTWEIVRGVIHPDFRGGGLGTLLAQRALGRALESAECDLIVGFPRSRVMYRILNETVSPALHAIGHDGGINVAGGQREFHLVGMAIPRPQRFEWCRLPAGRFVENEILKPLELCGTHQPYPPLIIAGDAPRHPDYGPFTFSYHPFCPSDALEISGYNGSRHSESSIAEDLLGTMASFSHARHVRLTVLADKAVIQGTLLKQGFKITAYLPAWHLQNGVRYDCVMLTWLAPGIQPVDHGVRDLVDHFNQGLN